MIKTQLVSELSDQQLIEFCQKANLAYRQGEPIISDEDYDFIYLAELKKRQPNHPLLQKVEPEGKGFSNEKLLLPQAMLSTDKAYTFEEIENWCARLEKASNEINFNNITIKATPKLDGFAAFDDGIKLYTRGDGRKGSDISRVFERGLTIFKNNSRGLGAGEIVIKKSYFEKNLKQHFEHPRNFQASIIKEKTLDSLAQQAIIDNAALFVPFVSLPFWSGDIQTLKNDFKEIVKNCLNSVDFDVDGVVFETTNKALKDYLGSNRKFHHWQIAFKENKEKAQVKVLNITPQVGRTGKITPVAQLEPTQLSGAMINRATAYHYGFVKKNSLGENSMIELTRSGQVIPKIIKVLTPTTNLTIPSICPSCKENLTWQNDFLICNNHQKCPQQQIQKMTYFFSSLANNDGFGLATIQKLYANNIYSISEIYQLSEKDLIQIGFGEKTSQNLIKELNKSRHNPIEDWRFLASFGIERLGFGFCEKLLKKHPLETIFSLTKEDLINVEGFAETSADYIIDGLQKIKDEFTKLFNLGFNLEISKGFDIKHELLNKNIVFSGSMDLSRQLMTKQAKAIGINVLSSVSAKTDYLVVGKNVGAKKLENAKNKGVKILTLKNYLEMIKGL
ncbi:DNA ligase [hydrothermal vent metagenome]|uniref:DNA ligase (NAD(+)) n=1 Tax=hydrothermal vent metagenome TaxID=652676 RepID=A0A1W1BJ82_9ZZZZ